MRIILSDVMMDYLRNVGKFAIPVALAFSLANGAMTQEEGKIKLIGERYTQKNYVHVHLIPSEGGIVNNGPTIDINIQGPESAKSGERVVYTIKLEGTFSDEVKIIVGAEADCGRVMEGEVSIPAGVLELSEDHKIDAGRIGSAFRDEIDDLPAWASNDSYSRFGLVVTEGDINRSGKEVSRNKWDRPIPSLTFKVPVVFRKSGYVKASVLYSLSWDISNGRFHYEDRDIWSDMLFVEVGD